MGAEPDPDREAEDALHRFVAGEGAAFDEVVRAHQDRVFRLAVSLLGGREDARDATQEAFLRAFRGLKHWRFEARPSTWLFRLTFNVCREMRRRGLRERIKRARWALLAAPWFPRGPGPAASEPDRPLGRLVDRLPARQREVIVLRIFEELSVVETANVLGVPEGTVKSNFSKAVASLRSRLAEAEQGKEAACRRRGRLKTTS